VEIRLLPLVVALIVLALVGAVAYFALPRLLPRAAQLGLRPAPATVAARPATVPAGGPGIPETAGGAVTYQDESLGWDWTADCTLQLRQFLADKLPGRRISSLQVVLVENKPDSKLPFGVRYPDQAGAQANGNCYDMGGGNYTCSVGVACGEPGADLDVAVTLAAPCTLLDMFLARGANPDAIRRTWKWGTFQPLIVPLKDTENQWQSTCLRVSRAS
jgi:hypothetical protein